MNRRSVAACRYVFVGSRALRGLSNYGSSVGWSVLYGFVLVSSSADIFVSIMMVGVALRLHVRRATSLRTADLSYATNRCMFSFLSSL